MSVQTKTFIGRLNKEDVEKRANDWLETNLIKWEQIKQWNWTKNEKENLDMLVIWYENK